MGIEVRIIADSVSPQGKRITTFQLKYQRFFHSELMTHRMLSRNASSSRAIPVSKMISQVWNDPAMPIHWGQNKAGMQANTELSGFKLKLAKALWVATGRVACIASWGMMKVGMHKQVTNRILEPWQYIHVVVTATNWDNFFALRNHKDAQPEFRALAALMEHEMDSNLPTELAADEWHLPYMTTEEIELAKYMGSYSDLPKRSAARCARVSYNKHDGSEPSYDDDMELYNQLITRPFTDKRGNTYGDDSPIHASPVEHQAYPAANPYEVWGNFAGWVQLRKLIETNSYEGNVNEYPGY